MTDRASTSLVTPAQRALRRLLSAAFDDPSLATETVLKALTAANVDELPGDAAEVLEFTREHIQPVVSSALGAHLAAALVSDLQEELLVLPTPPTPMQPPALFAAPPRASPLERSSAPRMVANLSCAVLLVDVDRLGRAPLARALVRGGCNVTAVEDVAGATAALRAEKIDVAILDGDSPALDGLVKAIVEAPGSVAIVARADRVAAANSKLLASGARDFAVRAKSARPNELLELIARFVGPT